MSFESIVMQQLGKRDVKMGVTLSDPTRKAPYDDIGSGATSFFSFNGLEAIPINSSEKELTGNNSQHARVNPIVNVHTFPTPMKSDFNYMMRAQQTYKILLHSTNTDDSRKDYSGDRRLVIHKAQEKCVLDPVTWNFVQAITERYPSDRSKVLTPEEVFSKWAFLGPTVSDGGYEVFARERNPNKKQKRQFNNAQWGYCATVDVWGGNLFKPNTSLWYILKKVRTPQEFLVDPYGAPVVVKDFLVGQGAALGEEGEVHFSEETPVITPIPFQLVPWADSKKKRPSRKELEYRDEFGILRYGKAFRIGFFHNNGGTDDIGRDFGPDVRSNTVLSSNGSLRVIWILYDPSD
jgi:hypothetical protein